MYRLQILLDKREKDLFKYTYEALLKLPDERLRKISIKQEDMPIGDIIFQLIENNDSTPEMDNKKQILIIERKAFLDLLASIKDGRYEEQSHRLTNASGLPTHSIMYLLEGMFSQVLERDKKIIYSTMASLNVFKGFSILRTSTIFETGEVLVAFADKILRDIEKGRVPVCFAKKVENNLVLSEVDPIFAGQTIYQDANEVTEVSEPELQNYCNFVKKVKKENITPENIGEIILSQIPGISSVTAIAIMKKFSTFPIFIDALKKDHNCLDDIVTESNGKTRKINKTCVENIRKYFI
jgi:ERCC4-type nuclease